MEKRDFLKTLSTAAVAAPVAALTARLMTDDAPATPNTTASNAFARVQQTRTLRCAYAAYNPMVIIDPNTRQLSGIFYDLVNEIGKRANIAVEWVEEVGYGNINAGFVTNRYEAFAAGLWPAGSRAVNTVFSAPLFYDPISIWVNAKDTRFDDGQDGSGWEKLNSPDYTVTYTDGDGTQNMKAAFFPLAKSAPSSQADAIADECSKVATGKADAMFRDLISGDLYLKNNPGSIKNVSPGQPVIMYPLTIGFNQNEHGLKSMVDAVIYELQQDGTVNRTIKKYLGDQAQLFMYADITYKPFV